MVQGHRWFILPIRTTEDRLQDAICQTWELFCRYATAKHRVLPDAFLVNFCHWRATDPSHSFVPPKCRRRRDVFNRTAYHAAEIEVLRMEGIDREGAEGDRGLQVGFTEELAPSTERKLNSAIDLNKWLRGLNRKDRYLMTGKLQGHIFGDLASELSLNYDDIWYRVKKLGLELAARACISIGASNDKRRQTHKRDILDSTIRDADAALSIS